MAKTIVFFQREMITIYRKQQILSYLKAQFRRRTFHELNLIQIKAGPNHANSTF